MLDLELDMIHDKLSETEGTTPTFNHTILKYKCVNV